MNKKLLSALFIFLCASVVHAVISQSIPSRDIVVSNRNGVAEFSNCEVYGEPGQPHLPVYNCGILLPPDADLNTVTISIRGLKERSVGTYTVRPSPPPMSINGPCWPLNRSIVNGKDIGIYTENMVHPKQYVRVTNKGRMNCFKILAVCVNLARYNPVTRELTRMEAGELAVDFKIDSKYNRSRNRSLQIPASAKKRVENYVVNYTKFASAYDNDFTFINETKMVLVTTEAINSASTKLNNFLISKTARQISVDIATESQWGGTAESLRTWLQENYQENGWEYLLIIGHYKDGVPMMNFPDYTGSTDCLSDWPFAQLDGDFKSDKTIEIHYGRIPIYNNNIEELDAILTKTIAYESVSEEHIGWRKHLLLLGPGFNSGVNMACEPYNYLHENVIEKIPEWDDYRMYGNRWGEPVGDFDEMVGQGDAAIEKIVAKWAEGPFGVISWSTHGSPESAQDVLKSSYTPQLKNDYPGFEICGSCSNATPSNSRNLSWSLLKDASMGVIGGTTITYYGGSFLTSGSDGAWSYHFARTMVEDSMTIGESLTFLREMAPNSFGWQNRAPYVLYGDPTIGAYTCNMESYVAVMSPNGGEEWEQGRSFDIVWMANFDDNVKIELLKGGAVEEVLAASVSPVAPYTWDVPADFPLATDYKIRVTCVVQDTLVDESNGNFTIEEKTKLAITTPNGGENIEKDSEVEIKWEDNLDGNLKIDLIRDSTIYANIVESVPSNGLYKWKVSDLIASGSEYKLRITSIDKDWLYDESDADITIRSPLVYQFPYIQNFDDFEDSTTVFREYWEQLDGDDLDWTVWTGMTPTKYPDQGAATGPDGDHTSGDGNYLYVESSGSNNPDKKADIITPVFDLRYLEKGTCTFWYHMFSDSQEMGDLYVDMSIDEIWEEGVLHFSKDQGDVWKTETIDLTDCHRKKVQFRFRAVTGSGWASDICIDDFSIDGEVSISAKIIKIPSSVDLKANGPRIYYQIPESFNRKQVSIKLYNIQGKSIRTLVKGPVDAGYHIVRLDKPNNGNELAAGFYLCRMKMKGFSKTVKVTLGR